MKQTMVDGNYGRFKVEFAGDTPQELFEQMLGFLMSVGILKKENLQPKPAEAAEQK